MTIFKNDTENNNEIIQLLVNNNIYISYIFNSFIETQKDVR